MRAKAAPEVIAARVANANLMGEGLESMIGYRVLVYCPSFFHEGLLAGVNLEWLRLDDPHVVYDSGLPDAKDYADISPTGQDHRYVRLDMVEAVEMSRKQMKRSPDR